MNYKTCYEYLSFNDAKLFTVVCLPDASGQYPTVIYRSPYDEAEDTLSEEELCEKKAADYLGWVERGYAVVVQHCRGCGKSEGEFSPDIY